MSNATASRGHVDAPQLQAPRNLCKAFALYTAQQVFSGYAVVVKSQLAGVDGFVTKFLHLLGNDKAFRLFSNEQTHAFVARLCLRVCFDQQQQAVALSAVGDPRLRTVDDVMIAIALRLGANGLQVGSCVGLCQTNAAAKLSSGHARQVFVFLFVSSKAFYGCGHDQVRIEYPGGRHPCACNSNHNLGVGSGREAQAAIILTDGCAKQTECFHLLHQVMRVLIGVVKALGNRAHLFLNPNVDAVQNRAFVLHVPA